MDTQSTFEAVTLEKAWSMLSYIPAQDRDTWISVGMALKSELGDDAYSIYDNWSQSASNYQARSVRDVWKSFKRRGITFATVAKLALDAGYRDSANKLPLPPKIAAPKHSSSTSDYAKKLFRACNRGDALVSEHEYARAKGIEWAAGAGRGKATGKLIGNNSDCIIVPVRNIEATEVQGVQCINRSGIKQSFGSISGGTLILGNTLKLKAEWFVAEGWASAVSTVFHHQKDVCACAFGKWNMEKVANQISAFYSPDQIVILKEQD
ncbi:PriCT-2 domain-containing protein [Pseudomonadales bacterium]|nr:PriCT-2 domain-containing protein [Pseudomonadales bacterium]